MSVYFTKDHEYVRVEGEIGVVGISAYAQEQLGDIVYVELPEAGKALMTGDEAAIVESVKAASEVYAPVSGEVIEANDDLADNPALVNETPEDGAWFFKLKLTDQGELENLMSADDYKAYIEDMG